MSQLIKVRESWLQVDYEDLVPGEFVLIRDNDWPAYGVLAHYDRKNSAGEYVITIIGATGYAYDEVRQWLGTEYPAWTSALLPSDEVIQVPDDEVPDQWVAWHTQVQLGLPAEHIEFEWLNQGDD